MERFIGAEIQGEKKNLKAVLLHDYYLDVIWVWTLESFL